MPPKKVKCSCKKHMEIAGTSTEIKVSRISSRLYPAASIKNLKNEGLLTSRSLFICQHCANFGASDFFSKKETFKKLNVADIVQSIKNGDFTKEELCQIGTALGETIQQEIYQEGQKMTKLYKSETLATFDYLSPIADCNDILTDFLKAATNYRETSSNSKKFALATCLELVHYSRNVNIITPLSFTINLISYFQTGSKANVNLLASVLPCGSYTALGAWIAESSSVPNDCPPVGDIISFFDNNQVLGRNWRVSLHHKAKCNTVTNLIHIAPTSPADIQYNENFSPHKWLQSATPALLSNLSTLDTESEALFKQYQTEYINTRIRHICTQQTLNNSTGRYEDDIDTADTPAPTGPFKQHTDPYIIAPHFHPPSPPSITIGEPIMANPCSYKAVGEVVDKMCKAAGIGDGRMWTIIGSDGSPYQLASKLQERFLVCQLCRQEFDRTDTSEMDKHVQFHGEEGTIFQQKFANVLFIPGPGHIEIHMVRGLFRISWDLFMSKIGQIMGFSSARAQFVCKAATDHHKSWQLCLVALYGSGDELLLPYCREAMKAGESPTATGFWKWVEECQRPTVEVMATLIFRYYLALFLYRCAMRRNNSPLLLASRTCFSPLWSGVNKTQYQELHFRDSLMRSQCPPEVRQFLDKYECMSPSGNPSKGEGGDFILENVNRKVKRWLPSGVPEEKHWLRSCRNIDALEKIRNNILKKDATPSTVTITEKSLEREIIGWRKEVREKQWFGLSDQSLPTTISGLVTDSSFPAFHTKCVGNQMSFRRQTVGLIPKSKLEPVFVIKKDRETNTKK